MSIRMRTLVLFIATGFFFATLAVCFAHNLPREQAYMAGILLVAGILWFTEVVPLFATALLIIGLEVLLLANPGHWRGLGFAEGNGVTFSHIINAAAAPVVVLFFSGFVMASAAVKEGVDQTMASLFLRPFTKSPRRLLIGVMGVTALFSMWMSNTATTAFMLTLIMPFVAQIPREDPFRKCLLLAVPFTSAIGALSTPVSSPPNAIAVGYLQREGIHIGFIEWMIAAIPLSILMLVVTGLVLWFFFPTRNKTLSFSIPLRPITLRSGYVAGVFTLTVLLWITERLHGLPATAVSMIPVVMLTLGGIIRRREINNLDWDVLLLIGGGLVLGYGLEATGLDKYLLRTLPIHGVFPLLTALLFLAFILGTFLSNTAVANILLPMGIAAATMVNPESARVLTLSVAFMCSLTFPLPISTPPNAMAYARGGFTTRDMAVTGGLIGLIGLGIILIGSRWLI